MAKPPKDRLSKIPRAFRKILLEQMKGQEILDSDELSLFEWYVSERSKTIDLMLTEERAYIKEQVDAGLDVGDVNDGRAVEYYIKRVRYADVIYLTSLLELYLSRASKKLEEVLGDHNVTFRPDELIGNKWMKHKKFLEGYGKFYFPVDAWTTLLTLIDVRNILVHENGYVAAVYSKNLRIIQKSPGLQTVHNELVIEDAYITHCQSAFRSLIECVNSQINQSIKHTLQPQALKPASRKQFAE